MRLTVFSVVFACLALCCAHVSAQQWPNMVNNLPGLDFPVTSYAGLINVNATTNSNHFYWLFEPLSGNTNAPLLLWLNGGPGSSSLFGLFGEHGPFSVSADATTLVQRDITWIKNYYVVYVDNPVGTGFSFTDSVDGFVTNEEQVGYNLYTFFVQFYNLYPQLLNNDLILCGESYAGKYIPALGYTIHNENLRYKLIQEKGLKNLLPRQDGRPEPNVALPLVAISIGDGMMDPLTQVPGYGSFLFGLSLISLPERAHFEALEQQVVELINAGSFTEAFQVFDPMMNGDFFPYPSYFTNVTGLTNYDNFQSPSYPANPFTTYLNRQDVQAALNFPSYRTYSSDNDTVEYYLIDDWMRSVKPYVETLLDNYPILMYNGQNDIILNAPACENYISTLNWNGAEEFNNANKVIWKVSASDSLPAGYARQGGGLTYVMVAAAGHLLPLDQPRSAFDMLTRFIEKIPFN